MPHTTPILHSRLLRTVNFNASSNTLVQICSAMQMSADGSISAAAVFGGNGQYS